MAAAFAPSATPRREAVPPPPSAPPAKKVKTNDELRTKIGEFSKEFADGVAVTVHEDAFQNAADELCDCLQAIPGRYYKIGELEGFPVFRQERKSGALNDQELFLYHVEAQDKRGWYISDTLKAVDSPQTKHFAWGPCNGNSFPEKLHTPFWAKKQNLYISVEALHDWADKIIGELHYQVQAQQPALKAKPKEPSAPDKGKGKGKDGKGKIANGWMNRTVPLVAAILVQDNEAAYAIAQKYMDSFPTFAAEVDKQLDRQLKSYDKDE